MVNNGLTDSRATLAREEERRLIQAARAGDEKAMGRIVEILSGPVYRFGRTFCRNPQDAEDVMQDVLTSAIRSVGSFSGRSSLTTWAYVIARNACSRMRRKRPGEPAHLEPLESAASGAGRRVPDRGSDPEGDLRISEIREALRRAMAGLPVPQREAVLLRDVEGVSASRAARILGLTVPALKSRLHRARGALRQALADHYEDHRPSRLLDDCRAMGRLKAPSRVRRVVRQALAPPKSAA
jgi:RNA polymerase sigma-70 factor (ECF subfamily)